MTRGLIAATVYFLGLFALGFALGIIRVLVVIPRFGELAGTILEAPFMLVAAYVGCRCIIHRWNVSNSRKIRWAMVLWFLALLMVFETVLGTLLFGLTLADQSAAFGTSAGFLGLSAQLASALMLVVIRNRHQKKIPRV